MLFISNNELRFAKARKTCSTNLLMSILGCGYEYNILCRPEEPLDIQSELIFVNSIVHLPRVDNVKMKI